MRKFMISLAAAGAALAVATPAAAQYYPQPQPYAGQPYGNGYGYQNGRVNFRQIRALQVRVDQIQRQITRLAQRRIISGSEFRNRQEDARDLERKLHRDARDGRGLTSREVYDIERRIVRLEQKIARDANDGHRWGASNNGYNGNYGSYDRDRDGRDDRYEDDRGYQRDR